MSSSSSFRTFAPIWVGVSALTVLVWELAAHGSAQYMPAKPAQELDFVRISLSNPAQAADASQHSETSALIDFDPETHWQSQRRSIPVSIDTKLGQRGIPDQDFRGAVTVRASGRSQPFSDAKLLANGQLVVVSGYGDGFSGKKTELRFTARADGSVAGEVATCCFVDVGPTDEFWTDLSGHAVISTNAWKHGDVLFVEYEVCGLRNGVSLVDSGRLRVELPR